MLFKSMLATLLILAAAMPAGILHGQRSTPPAPTNLQAVPLDAGHIRLTWTPGGDSTATQHVVAYDPDTMATNPLINLDPAVSTYTVISLAESRHYCFFIYVSNDAGDSDSSNGACADTP